MIGFKDEHQAPASPAALLHQVEQAFAPGGDLQTILGLEHRPQQERMALAVAASFAADAPLLFEAGTGVGKSLAYLLPGIIQAVDRERPFLVSTATISLQEQILEKDLTLCRTLFQAIPRLHHCVDFRAALLLGKSNYLCPTRLSQAVATKAELFPGPDQEELQRIIEWSYSTREGLRQELNPAPSGAVWEWVNADSSACNRRNCSPENCYYQRAKAALQRAHLVVINHSLLFSLISAGMPAAFKPPGVLFARDFLVLDEAHTVPAIATDHFGLRLSSYGLDRLLKSLYNPRTQRGFFKRYGQARHMQSVIDAIEAAELFFRFIREHHLHQRPEVRLREADWCESTLGPPLRAVIDAAGQLADRLEEGPARSEMLDQQNRLKTYHSGIQDFIALKAEDHVHWLERGGQKGQIVTLRNAPLDVAPYLEEALFRRQTSVVMTSATLALGRSMENFQAQAGALKVPSSIEDSPFDFQRNMRVYIARDVPLPTREHAQLSIDTLADYILFCVGKVPGGTLVLFTSYSDMQKVAGQLEEELARSGRTLFIQGTEFSRTEATRRFKLAENAVLFGTDSFWTGVDIPGPALSQVIVTRLPFENPTHPVAEAKCEWIRERGGNPFNEYTLPASLIKFRQGIGRLIRKRTDRGIITILDSRLLAKAYGRQFLACLPVSQYDVITRENREARFRHP
jgi:ATP-dependent DNA helicase DinG